jgi:hypothetical protein
VRVESVALEDHRDVAILRRDVVDHAVADLEVAGADLLEAGDHPKAGRLATAGRADQDHELAVLDLEVEVLHRREVAVLLRDVLERDRRHRSTPLAAAFVAGPCICRPERRLDGPHTRNASVEPC